MREPLPPFVVGPAEGRLITRFEIIDNDGARNVQALDKFPPLNILGLRRLAKILLAYADILEYGSPQR